MPLQNPPQRGPSGTVDPTANVLALVEAAVKRLDDLRNAESRRIDEQSMLRAEYADKLAVAEAKRIDAIRAVDVNAVAVASERAAAQASVLANQVSQSSEALRGLVSTTAAAVATSQQQIVTMLSERLSKLEQASYEGKGRQSFADPRFEDLAEQVERMNGMMSTGVGRTAGANALWGYIIGGIGLLIGFGGLIMALLRMKG